MTMMHFPLFLLPLDNGQLLGALLGSELQTVDHSVEQIKRQLSEWLRRESRSTEPGSFASNSDREPEIHDATLRLVTVPVRLAYRGPKGDYPVATPLPIKVAAVYGENRDAGYWKCYLPILEVDFYFYELSQLRALIELYTRDVLERTAPEQAHRYLMQHTPLLDEVRVRLDNGRNQSRKIEPEVQFSTQLRRLCDQLPLPRARHNQLLPEQPWERADFVAELSALLSESPANVLLVGDSGVGKTTIWLEVIRRVHRASRCTEQPRRFFRTSAQRFIGDARWLGEWQENCELVAEELFGVGGLIYITDIVNLLTTGGEGPEDSVAAFLIPFMRQRKLFMLAEMTPAELNAARRLLPGFLDHFKIFRIDELDSTQTRNVLRHFAKYAATNFRISFDEKALARAQAALERHVPYERFPGKAMRLMQACIRTARREDRYQVDTTHVLDELARRSGLARSLIDDSSLLDLQRTNQFFRQRIVGQDPVLERLVSVVATYKAGLNDPERPIATMMFCGPTGVGKTATAKAISEYFFSRGQLQEPLFRLDMSEYQHPAQVARLLGNGHDDPGILAKHFRDRPFGVLLLDEIEKANDAFFDMLLTALDEGRLSDALGRVTDFRNAIVILTSNLGSGASSLGFVPDSSETDLEAVRQFFRPEFYNRLDQIVEFQPLSSSSIEAIARIELDQLKHLEGVVKREITLEVTEDAVKWIAKVGFSRKFGARPLQRAIVQQVVSKLSEFLLEQPHFQRETLVIDIENNVVMLGAKQA